MIVADSQMIVTCSDLLDPFDPARGEDELGLHGWMIKRLSKLFLMVSRFLSQNTRPSSKKNAWGDDQELI